MRHTRWASRSHKRHDKRAVMNTTNLPVSSAPTDSPKQLSLTLRRSRLSVRTSIQTGSTGTSSLPCPYGTYKTSSIKT